MNLYGSRVQSLCHYQAFVVCAIVARFIEHRCTFVNSNGGFHQQIDTVPVHMRWTIVLIARNACIGAADFLISVLRLSVHRKIAVHSDTNKDHTTTCLMREKRKSGDKLTTQPHTFVHAHAHTALSSSHSRN